MTSRTHARVGSGRIYIVTPGGASGQGGIGRMVSYIERSWNQHSAPLTIVDSYGPGSKAKMPFYFAAALIRLFCAALLGNIGLLHIQMSERLSVVRKGLVVYLGRAFGIPVVLHLHGADFADYCRGLAAWKLKLLKHMMAQADAVITLGDYWRDFVRDELNVDPARIGVLHNAVPQPPVAMEVNRSSVLNQRCEMLFLGVVSERKGVPILLSALATPIMAELDWHLTLAGNGALEEYQAEAARLGLTERLTFTGWVDETRARELLAQADLMVLPSRNEGLPMAILEAMAYRLPVVATPVGSIAEAVLDGESGWLVPVGNCYALAQALASLVRDPMLRVQMGLTARQHFLNKFEIGKYIRRLAKIYQTAQAHLPLREEQGVAQMVDEGR